MKSGQKKKGQSSKIALKEGGRARSNVRMAKSYETCFCRFFPTNGEGS